MTAGEDVRTRKSHEREVCSVCTSADRLYLRYDAFHLHRLHCLFHDVVMRFDLLAHVVVLMLQFEGCCTFSVFFIDEIHTFLDVCLLLLVEVHVMVADDV